MSHPSQPVRRPPASAKRFNQVVSRFAGRYVYALLRHTGRRSGKTYTTPVVALRTKAGIIVPLAWGTSADWYQNIVANGGADLQLGGRWYHGSEPRLLSRAEAQSYLPPFTRIAGRFFPIANYLLLTET